MRKESLFRVDGKTEVRFESSGKVLRDRVAIKTTRATSLGDRVKSDSNGLTFKTLKEKS